MYIRASLILNAAHREAVAFVAVVLVHLAVVVIHVPVVTVAAAAGVIRSRPPVAVSGAAEFAVGSAAAAGQGGKSVNIRAVAVFFPPGS